MSLTLKQEAFCRSYIETGNASEAYRRAYSADGMNPATIKKRASELLSRGDIRGTVNQLQSAAAERSNITADRVLREYARIAFGDVTDIASWDREVIIAKCSESLSEDASRAVQEVSATREGIKIKMHDKVRALDALAKHLGLFEADNKQREITVTISQQYADVL